MGGGSGSNEPIGGNIPPKENPGLEGVRALKGGGGKGSVTRWPQTIKGLWQNSSMIADLNTLKLAMH